MLLEIVTKKDEYLARGTNVELVDVELREEVAVEVREDVTVELGKEVDTEAEPIRVDTKLDTSGDWSRTGN